MKSLATLSSRIILKIKSSQDYSIAFTGGHGLSHAIVDPDFLNDIFSIDLHVVDSHFAKLLLRLLRRKCPKIPGPVFFNELFFSNRKVLSGSRICFYGGSWQALLELKEDLMAAGYVVENLKFISPEFSSDKLLVAKAHADEINSFRPDVTCLFLGCPHQERVAVAVGWPGVKICFGAAIHLRKPTQLNSLARSLGLEFFFRLVFEFRKTAPRILSMTTSALSPFVLARIANRLNWYDAN